MIQLGLFDGSFPKQNSATLAGDRISEAPQNIVWQRNRYLDVNFYTDQCLREVILAPNGSVNVAWLIEPPSFSSTHYAVAYTMRDYFGFIISFHKEFLTAFPPNRQGLLYYPLGGSWIKQSDWGLHEKSRLVSLICSEKKRAAGHKVRHAAADMSELYGIDLYGRKYNPIASKTTALRDYKYAIIIESMCIPGYFSEKLIDCLSQGTVPIYWGHKDTVLSIFDKDGFIFFDTISELTKIIIGLNEIDYDDRFADARRNNLETAARFTCAEDFIWNEYGERILDHKWPNIHIDTNPISRFL